MNNQQITGFIFWTLTLACITIIQCTDAITTLTQDIYIVVMGVVGILFMINWKEVK